MPNVRFDIIRKSISRIRYEAEYGLTELKRLQSENRTVDVGPEIQAVLEAIRSTATHDVAGEYDALLGKLGAGPVNDHDATGPPSVNAKFIITWLQSDLITLDHLIRKMRAAAEEQPIGGNGHDYSLLVMLLEAVGTGMLEAHKELHDELQPLLDTKTPM